MIFLKSIYKYKLLSVFLLFSYCDSKIDLLVHNAIVYSVDDYEGIYTSFAVNNGKFIAVGGDEIYINILKKNIFVKCGKNRSFL